MAGLLKNITSMFRRNIPQSEARQTRPRQGRFIRGRFDAAQTTHDNQKHWAAADGFSADLAASPEVRKQLRERARYEVANNSYARGIVLTIANDTIGTGPRLQLMGNDPSLNREIEHEFAAWAFAVNLPEKLRTMRMARTTDGESFAMLAANSAIEHSIQMDFQLIEAERITGELSFTPRDNDIDGIKLDKHGNPISYRILKTHPGGQSFSLSENANTIQAEAMIHCFRMDRPQQHRGIPEITPALPLFAQLRRFTLAVITAAESAANFSGILYTDAPASGEADSVEPMDLIELERNMLLTMPGGWKMSQLQPEQPATTYAEFKHEILNEIARCLNMPYNIAAGNSSGYNYSSGRLDHQTYFKAIRVDQDFIARTVLDRVLHVWLTEYLLASNNTACQILPAHQWFWDGMEHVDPYKEANAQKLRLLNNTTTLAYEYARQGRDWEEELHQIAREKDLLHELGIANEDKEKSKTAILENNENE